MSSSLQVSSSSAPNYQPIFEKALQEYKKKTGKDPTTDPLADEITGCDSPDAILAILEGKVNELNQSWSSDERLTKWLNPTVNILNALSATLGEVASSAFPPTKIIFSGISILLVAAMNTVASRGVLIELFDRIESFFGRLKIHTEEPPTPVVMDVLAKIMAEVLSILAIATKGMKERRAITFFKTLAGMNGIGDAIQKFGKLEQGELLTVIAQVSRNTSGLKDDAKQIKGMVEKIVKTMDARDWEEVLRKLKGWLSPPDPSTNYNIGLRDLHRETTTWFLEGPIFQEWLSIGSLLWIHGKPGSGKSILCSAIIQHIISLCGDGGAYVGYFYFDFRVDDKKHRHKLVPSLLIQFAAYSIPCCDIISRVYSAHGKGTQKPSDGDLMNCLTNMLLAMTQHPIYIIMDALDECPDSSGVRSPREQVLSFVEELAELRLRNLHICITSRPEIDIRKRLGPLTSLCVSLHHQSGHKNDIANYISSEVDFVAKKRGWRNGDKELVIKTLSEKADGMFRWVFCQLEMLRACLQSKVRDLLDELPDSLDETYERVLKEIHKINRAHVQRLLQCLAVAIRPLRVYEAAEILTSDPGAIKGEVPMFNVDWRKNVPGLVGVVITDRKAIEGKSPMFDADWHPEDQEQELLSACPSLITIVEDRGSRVVQFSHFSVKEFLTSDRLAASREGISCYHITPNNAHMTVAQATLGTLLRLDDHIDRRNVMKFPLAVYAAEYWVSHAQASAQVGSVSSRVMSTMKTLFDSDKPHLAAWVRIYDVDDPRLWSFTRQTPNPLYYSVHCGFYDLVKHLLKKHSQHVNDLGGNHGCLLVAALHGGHIRVAELLIQHGANVDVKGKEEQTPLHNSIQWPNNLAVAAVRFLLEHGADVNARRKDLSTPLHLAADHGNFEVAQLLLQRGVDVNSRNDDGETPLHLVPKLASTRSKGNRPNIVQLLLEYGAEVNSQDEMDATALHNASYVLDPEVARMLVHHHANVDALNSWGQTPLQRAFDGNPNFPKARVDVVQLLVERGANVNPRRNKSWTALQGASFSTDCESMRLLLDHGANVNVGDDRGLTPLHLVFGSKGSFWHRFGVAQLLIEHGADVNTGDNNHETPLHLASSHLDLELVQVFLDHGATVNAKDNKGKSPLHRVAEHKYYFPNGYLGLDRHFLKPGTGVDTGTQPEYEPAFRLATRFGSLEAAWILLKHGADLNVENKDGRIPFQLVQESMREEMKLSPSEYSIRRAQRVQGVALMGLLYGY